MSSSFVLNFRDGHSTNSAGALPVTPKEKIVQKAAELPHPPPHPHAQAVTSPRPILSTVSYAPIYQNDQLHTGTPQRKLLEPSSNFERSDALIRARITLTFYTWSASLHSTSVLTCSAVYFSKFYLSSSVSCYSGIFGARRRLPDFWGTQLSNSTFEKKNQISRFESP